ncbi:hypothetical protein [Mycobacterium sp. 236(2023)]|uniref:hypothetical protein n=1 Tax=Mycobacterium sp. 236(2023) TaxID=3038163 RepID=UPI002414DAE7|nr:hypothetical protein [Mycobacterium sp. 236(2023)]MDG4668801.1 hypothetical protein [Mycobacterium sp. 236(2023)]
MLYPTSGPAGGPTSPSPKSFALLAFVVAAVVFVGAGVFTAWAYLRPAGSHAAAPTPTNDPAPPPSAPDWQPYVDAGKEFAESLASYDHRTIDADVQRILDTSTGQFHRDFAETAPGFIDLTRDIRSVSTGTVTGAGLERIRDDHADVLVAVSVETANGDGPPAAPRFWRMRIGVAHGADGYRADSVEYVP